MILLKALTSQDLMSELEQGLTCASCLTELLEKSGYWEVLLGNVQLWVMLLKALGFAAKCGTQTELRAVSGRGLSAASTPFWSAGLWGQSILCH